MKKKNLIVIALASTALTIGGGVALASAISSPKAVEVEAEGNYTFGFVNTDAWDNVYAYVWKDGGATGTAWPGDKITNKADFKIDGKDVYTVTINTGTYDRLIFNNNSGTQTGNLEIGNRPDHSIFIYNSGMASPRSWGLCGKLNGSSVWADDVQTGSVVPWSQTNTTVTATLRAGDTFKFRADGGWDAEISGATIAANNSTYFTTENTDAKVKDGKSGVYTFKIDWNVEAVGGSGITVQSYTEIPDWRMVGEGVAFPDVDGDGATSWDMGDAVPTAFNPGNHSEVKIENVTLTAGDVFKITNGSDKWFGWADVKSDSPLKDCFDGDSGNIKVKAGKTGSYTFFIDTTKSVDSGEGIWITNDAYVKLDGWATAFIDKEMDFCDAGDTDWNAFGTRFNSSELTDESRAIFKDATANKDGNNIEKAAYRYDNAVANHGKIAFAGSGGKRASAAHIITPMKDMEGGVATAIAVTAAVGAAAAVGFFFIRKRKAI